MELAVSVEHLHKRYGETVAVSDVSFAVEPNEIFGIIGPNGSGKTTTVEILQGLRPRDDGIVSVLGLDPARQGEALRRQIGSQLQESALPERMKVWEALDLFAAAAHTGRRDWRDAAEQWGIAGRRNAAFATLSGGERQRLFVALALITDPQLVFLDEMTTGLDPAARRVAWELIRTARDAGKTIVLVTHFMDEVETLCDRVAVVRQGTVVACDAPAALMRMQAGERTVRFSLPVDVPAGGLAWLSDVSHVRFWDREGENVAVRGDDAVLAHVAAALVARGIAPPDLRVELPTLEDAYMRLTGSEAS